MKIENTYILDIGSIERAQLKLDLALTLKSMYPWADEDTAYVMACAALDAATKRIERLKKEGENK